MAIESHEWRVWGLTGLEVTFLHFDYRFTLEIWSLQRALSVVFETPLTLYVPGSADRVFDPEQNGTLGPLLLLLHQSVLSFAASSDGRCLLRFVDGTELRSEPR